MKFLLVRLIQPNETFLSISALPYETEKHKNRICSL